MLVKPQATHMNAYARIILLMTAGEGIFVLPFLLARIFRPTFLKVFEVNNFQLGTLYTTYGVVALMSYLFGGTLADRYPPRKLMGVALIMTAMGGFFMASFPGFIALQILYGYWGFSTTFLFWAAMIKATRNWGGEENQGRAFGLLEGGRGIVAATIGALGILVFANLIQGQVTESSLLQIKEAFRWVILFTSIVVSLTGVIIYFYLQEVGSSEEDSEKTHKPLKNIKSVLKYSSVRLLIVVVLCAYCGYKVTDILSLYASEIMLFDEIDAAKVGSYQMYLRPLVCIIIGIVADQSSNAKWLIRGFLLLFIGALMFTSGTIQAPLNSLFITAVIITGLSTYGLRTLYFAAVKEGHVPYTYMGTAVGIISVVGYTPDIFMGPLMGYLLDTYPGILGFRWVFLFLAIFSSVGFFTSLRFMKTAKINTKA
ncbi:MAG: MFS transporter [Flavobacteriaceae bacterium]